MRNSAVVLLSILIGAAGNIAAFGANSGNKSLQQAAADGDLKEIKRHLDAGSDFNAADSYGITPLIRVIQGNRPEAAKLIIESGKANLNVKDRMGKTPLMLAVMMGAGAKETVEALLAKNADVNAKDSFDSTALHAAVQMANKDIVELLVQKGANVNAAAKNGQTPYTMATQPPGMPEIAELLKQNGAVAPQISQMDPYGNAPSGAGPGGPQGPGGAAARPILRIDPNEIQKMMLQFQDLAASLKTVDDKSMNEQRAWIQRRTDNRTSLLAAEQQQFADELAFLKPIAVQEKAVKTAKAIDDLTTKRKERTEQISEQLREQRRASLAQSRQSATAGAGAMGPRGGRGMRGQAQNNMAPGGYAGGAPYGSTTVPARRSAAANQPNQPPIDPNTQTQIQAWLNAKPEDKKVLLQTVTDLNLSELQTLDELATQEKATKTGVAIQCLMMLRQQRQEKITLAWQEDDVRMQRIQAQPGRAGMQGMPGAPPQQGQMPMRGRRGR